MNTKSKSKAISIGIAVIMMVSLFAVMSVSASIVTDCWIEDDNKVYFTVYSGEKVDRANGQLFLNGAYSGEHRMFSLTAGETATLSFRHIWNGFDDVEVRNDVDDDCCTPAGPTPLPDLVVSEKWEESVNEDVIVHFTVKNIGDGDAGSSTACMYIDGIEEDTAYVPALAVGASHVGAFAAEPCPPLTTIAVTVCADNDDVVEESDETNNCMTNDFTCPAKPDLVVIEKWEDSVDGQVIVHFIVENIGDGAAGASYATLYIDSVLVETQNVYVPALGPNGRFTDAFAAEPCTPDTTIIVTVCADDTHVVAESNEDNNCMTNYFQCPTQPKPDLVVSDKYETFEDGKVIVHFEIHNQGDADAGASYATKYLYIDGELEEKHNAAVPVIAPGGKFNGAFEPEDCPPGVDITVTVCADDTHVVDESIEDNNCMTNYFTCPIPPKPDLVVSEKWEDSVDGQVIVHFVVKNIGDGEAGASEAALYIDRVRVQTQNVPVSVLGPNGTFSGNFALEPCTPGTTITVKVCADDTNVVEESIETNNCMTNEYTCAAKPDLVVIEKWEESEYVCCGLWNVIVHFVVKNIGEADAGPSTACKKINGVLKDTASVPKLAGGESYASAFAPEPCPPGETINFTVCADNYDAVDESNETNNCMTNEYPCPAKADLVVIEKREESVNGQVTVYFVVKNNGTVNAGPSTACKKINGVLKDTASVPKLAAGESYASAFAPEPCPPGETINFTVCADNYDAVDESNETNNCMTNSFTCPILPQPDLVVAEMSNESVRADGHLIVHFIIENIGDGEAGESEAALYIDRVRVQTQNVPVSVLGPDGTFSGKFAPELCPLGTTINYTVCADDTNVVEESNETNNCKTDNFTCPLQGPDLVIDKTVTQRKVACNICEYEVDYTVTNIGNEVACGVCVGGQNQVALLVDGVLDGATQLCRRLGPGASVDGTFVWRNCPCGDDFTVTVYADYYNVVDEWNETNNWDINPLHCGKGKILVEKEVWDGNNWVDEILTAKRGDIVEFRGTVTNDGCCCELTNINVTDVLSASLEYVNATPTPSSITNNLVAGTTTIRWPKSQLGFCGVDEYRINASVRIDCGWDENTMTANATTCTGGVVTHSDSAKVYAPTEAGVTIDKTVKDPTTGDWVDVITVDRNDPLEFRCIVRNTGICQNLTFLTVWDTMDKLDILVQWGLFYTTSYGPLPPYAPQTPVISSGAFSTKVEWDIPWTAVSLSPGEELVFLVNATARGRGTWDNTAEVTAWSVDQLTGASEWVHGIDTVEVTIIP